MNAMQVVRDQALALPKGSLILVTGASGFIGSHVVNEALKAGYRVRGTSRSEDRAEYTKQVFDHHPNYSTAVVQDVQQSGAWDEAIRDVNAVIHMATDVSFNPDPNEVVKPTETGVLNIPLGQEWRDCATIRPDILFISRSRPSSQCGDLCGERRLVLGSCRRCLGATSVAGEKALWKFMREERPGFVANAVLPNFNVGTVMTAGGPTGGSVEQLLKGSVPDFPPQYHIDVVDDARIHLIAAALDPTIENERIFAFARPFTFTEIIEVLKELRPNDHNIAAVPEDEGQDLSKVPNKLGEGLLEKWYGQKGYKTMEQSIKECLTSLK